MDRDIIEKRIKELEQVIADCALIVERARDTARVFDSKASRALKELDKLTGSGQEEPKPKKASKVKK